MNAAFGDDDATSSSAGSTEGTSGTSTATTAAQTDASAEGTTTSPPTTLPPTTETTSTGEEATTDSDGEPGGTVVIPVDFFERPLDLPFFVARLRLNEAALFGFDPERIRVLDPNRNVPLPFEYIEVDPARGVLDFWVELPVWRTGGATPVDVYIDAPPDPPQSPWQHACAVWSFDLPAVAENLATGTMGTFFGGVAAQPPLDEGVVAQALAFDGLDDRFEAEVTPCGPELTAYAWVRQLSAEAGIRPIVAANSGWENGQRVDWGLAIVDGEELQARGRSSGTITIGSGYPDDGDWHHVGLRWSGDGLSLFLDGTEVGGGNLSPPPNVFAEPIISVAGFVGGPNIGSAGHLNARVDEVSVFAGAPPAAWFESVVENQADPEATYAVGRPYPL
ncbi:MAG: LamG-like jellyroll fold domain-containing protein [Myxococcota bacterium]